MKYPDRLARLGFNCLKEFFDILDVEIVVVNTCRQNL